MCSVSRRRLSSPDLVRTIRAWCVRVLPLPVYSCTVLRNLAYTVAPVVSLLSLSAARLHSKEYKEHDKEYKAHTHTPATAVTGPGLARERNVARAVSDEPFVVNRRRVASVRGLRGGALLATRHLFLPSACARVCLSFWDPGHCCYVLFE
jgi:hypothetical protein